MINRSLAPLKSTLLIFEADTNIFLKLTRKETDAGMTTLPASVSSSFITRTGHTSAVFKSNSMMKAAESQRESALLAKLFEDDRTPETNSHERTTTKCK
jgi:hypothetical protein